MLAIPSRMRASIVRLFSLPEKSKVEGWCGAGNVVVVDVVAMSPIYGGPWLREHITHTHTLSRISTLDVAAACLKLICNHNNNNKYGYGVWQRQPKKDCVYRESEVRLRFAIDKRTRPRHSAIFYSLVGALLRKRKHLLSKYSPATEQA